jgi:polysaccharide export outer membrane protein
MKKNYAMGMLLLCLLSPNHLLGETVVQRNQNERYIIGYGDLLNISVWKETGLTKQVLVLPDGTLTFPLVGEVMASGKTVNALEQEILKKIRRYMPEAVLNVEVVEVNSFQIYVIGKVINPGRFPLNSPLDVMQALTLAKGLTVFADEKEILIFRKTDAGQKIISFNYKDVSSGENLEQNIMLMRGDLIVVP